MTAIIIDVADAIAAELNDHDFGHDYTAERSYGDWDMELSDLEHVHVDVVPAEAKIEQDDRGETLHTVSIDVGIRKRFGPTTHMSDTGRVDKAEVNALVSLLQTFAEYLSPVGALAGRLPDVPEAAWDSVQVRALFIKDHLRELRQYTGIIRVTYQVTNDP